MWADAHLRFEETEKNGTGTWIALADAPEKWSIRHERLVFELKPTPVGHLGLFPEQAENWDWIEEQIRKFAPRLNTLPKEEEAANYFRVLNLFAYTGGSTLAAAASGAAVDASRRREKYRRLGEAKCRSFRSTTGPDPMDRRRCVEIRQTGSPSRDASTTP